MSFRDIIWTVIQLLLPVSKPETPEITSARVVELHCRKNKKSSIVYEQHHRLLRDVHTSFLAAGSDYITCNNYGVTPGVGFSDEEIVRYTTIADRVAREAHAERKTEEGTPPHLLESFVDMSNAVRNGVQVEADQSNYMHQVLSKSPQAPNTKRVESSAMNQQDEVAKEMLGWVSGYRDPEVIRRKESMRCKRKQPKRFGVTSDEQQRQALLPLKSIEGTNSSSDSEKGDSMSSDYSPKKDEDSEADEIEVVSLLGDESDEERVRMKRKRVRRNRAGESTFKRKKMRLRKPAVEHKSVTRTSSHQTTQDAGITLKVEPPGDIAKRSVMNTPATTKSASIIASPGSSSNQEIEHLSGPSKVKRESNSTSVDDNAAPEVDGYDTTMKSIIVTSPTCVNSVQSCLQKELYPDEVRDLHSELTKPASNDGKDDSDAIFGETFFQSTAVKCAANAPKNTLCTQPANTSDNAGVATNVSDMGTVESKLTSPIERK